MNTITANDLKAGVRYVDTVAGQTMNLTVVCDRGLCTHDKRDRYSVHVRGAGAEFFNAYHDDETFLTI